jgi:hypothetical protein
MALCLRPAFPAGGSVNTLKVYSLGAIRDPGTGRKRVVAMVGSCSKA